MEGGGVDGEFVGGVEGSGGGEGEEGEGGGFDGGGEKVGLDEGVKSGLVYY